MPAPDVQISPTARSSAPPGDAAQSSTQKVIRLVGLLVGAALFAYTLRDLDVRQLGQVFRDVGPAVLLILLPQAVGILFHTAAWKELLAALRGRASFFALFGVYVEAEAVRMALPAGPAISESYSAWQVKQRFDVPWTRSLASIAAKKAWVLCSHAACFVLLLIIGREAFARLAAGIPGGAALGWVAVIMSAALLSTGALTLTLLASRRAGSFVTSVLARLPWQRVKAWATEQQARPEAVAAASIPTKSHLVAGLFMLGQWITEILETWLILRLVGIPVTMTEALVIELGGSLVRSLVFVVPGGLGVQDASYVSLLTGLGHGGAGSSVAAFVLLKRMKDVFYVALGLGMFAVGRRAEKNPTLIENQL